MTASDAQTTTPSAGSAPSLDGDAALARRGDRAAGLRVAEALVQRTRNLARCLVADDSEADELAQAALIELLRKLRSFRGDGGFVRWADRFVATFVLSERGGKGERPTVVQGFSTHELVRTGASGAEARYWEQRAAVRGVDGLPEELRPAHVLRHVLNLSIDEVAEDLGVEASAAQDAVRNAHARLTAARMIAAKSGTAGRAPALVPDLRALSDEPGPARQRPPAEHASMARLALEMGMPLSAAKKEVPRWLAVVIALVLAVVGAIAGLTIRDWLDEQPVDASRRSVTPTRVRKAAARPQAPKTPAAAAVPNSEAPAPAAVPVTAGPAAAAVPVTAGPAPTPAPSGAAPTAGSAAPAPAQGDGKSPANAEGSAAPGTPAPSP